MPKRRLFRASVPPDGAAHAAPAGGSRRLLVGAAGRRRAAAAEEAENPDAIARPAAARLGERPRGGAGGLRGRRARTRLGCPELPDHIREAPLLGVVAMQRQRRRHILVHLGVAAVGLQRVAHAHPVATAAAAARRREPRRSSRSASQRRCLAALRARSLPSHVEQEFRKHMRDDVRAAAEPRGCQAHMDAFHEVMVRDFPTTSKSERSPTQEVIAKFLVREPPITVCAAA